MLLRSLIARSLLAGVKVLGRSRVTRHMCVDRRVGTGWLAGRRQIVATKALLVVCLG
jgi:hypothetical protein